MEINIFLKEYEEKLTNLFTKKACQTRKSALKKVIELFSDNDPDKFLNNLKTRESYTKLIENISNSSLNNKTVSKYINTVNVYIRVNNLVIETKENEVIKLIKDYSNIVTRLLSFSDILRTSNIIGELAEYLCEKYLGIKREVASNKGYDGIKDGIKYQIKARWIHSGNNGETEFGEIKLDKNNSPLYFDRFIGIVFDNDVSIMQVFILDQKNIQSLFNSMRRQKKIIRLQDVFPKGELRKGLSLVNSFDLDIEKMKKSLL